MDILQEQNEKNKKIKQKNKQNRKILKKIFQKGFHF